MSVSVVALSEICLRAPTSCLSFLESIHMFWQHFFCSLWSSPQQNTWSRVVGCHLRGWQGHSEILGGSTSPAPLRAALHAQRAPLPTPGRWCGRVMDQGPQSAVVETCELMFKFSLEKNEAWLLLSLTTPGLNRTTVVWVKGCVSFAY